jgi:hypothetical protein
MIVVDVDAAAVVVVAVAAEIVEIETLNSFDFADDVVD